MYLNGREIVNNNGCHGERERTSGNQWLTPGYHLVGVDMCENAGGEAMKLRYQGPDTGNRKVKVPQSALKHEKAWPSVVEICRVRVETVCGLSVEFGEELAPSLLRPDWSANTSITGITVGSQIWAACFCLEVMVSAGDG